MKVYKYKDYDEYVKAQQEASEKKWSNSFVDPESLEKLVMKYIYEELNIEPKLILCHGTRNGSEQKLFIDYFGKNQIHPQVIGTEIMTGSAGKAENTIEWDFHDVKDEWISNVDIIYSNSFDHSYKPEECLDSWMSCLNKNGVCIIEYDEICDSGSGSLVDCFGASLAYYKEIITKKYDIVDILSNKGMKDRSKTHNSKGGRNYIIIRNGDK